jgi:hypothetical protein
MKIKKGEGTSVDSEQWPVTARGFTAFSILLDAESMQSSGFILKKNPHSMHS